LRRLLRGLLRQREPLRLLTPVRGLFAPLLTILPCFLQLRAQERRNFTQRCHLGLKTRNGPTN
jgi:hypothetical protein